jgi:hypothetical protein
MAIFEINYVILSTVIACRVSILYRQLAIFHGGIAKKYAESLIRSIFL